MSGKPTYKELEKRIRELEQAESERVKVEKLLKDSEERLSETARIAKVGGWEIDLLGNTVAWTEETFRIHDLPPGKHPNVAEAIGFYHPDDQPMINTLVKHSVEAGEDFDFEARLITAKKNLKWVRAIGTIIMYQGRRSGVRGMVQDITERKRAEKALRESTERYRQLFENMTSGVAVYEAVDNGKDFIFKDLNQSVEKIEKVTKGDLIGKRVTSIFPGVEKFGILEVFQRVWRTGNPEHHPIMLYKDGRIAGWRKNYVYKLPSGDIVAIYDDVTERKQAEQALRKSEEKLRNIIEHSSNLFYSHTANHELTYVSPQSREFLQCEPEEAMMRWTEFITDNPVNKRGFDLTEKAIQTGQRQLPYELEIVGKKGRKIFVEVRESPLVINGKTVAIVGSLTDITERKLADQALKSSHERFLTVLNSIDATIYVADMETHEVLFMNQNMVEVFGRDMTGEICWEVFRGEAGPCSGCTNDQLIDENGNPTGVCIWDGKNPLTGKWYINYDRAIEWIDGRLVRLQVATDITELKNMEKMFRQAHKMEAIGTLAGGIAHDFNNLLMGIQGRASLLSSELGPSHAQNEHSEAIEKYVKSAASLTKQLLGFARGGKYNVEPISTRELIIGTADMFGRTHKELRIHKKIHPAPMVIEGDKQQIEQLLLNLYINAWQAMPEGGAIYLETALVSLDETECRPQNLEPGRYCKISVTDTGVGMDKVTLEQIFDPFFTTKDKERGTGLGLASAYSIVKSHDGMIKVSSEMGHGTRFEIFLPISEKKVRRKDQVDKGLIKGTETILMVDDEAMILEVGKAMLENLGYRVIAVNSGQKALSTIQTNADQIDLVLLDMIMPDMDGGKTFDAIRELKPRIPVLLSSGYAINGQASEIMRKGCNGFIQKPFNLSELSNTIRKILDNTKKVDNNSNQNSY